MVINNKGSPRCELHNRDIKIEQAQKVMRNRRQKMRHRKPKEYRNSKRCLPEAKQRMKR